jgi:pimeloyl-ACP methyl ester carboxylesterase
MNRRETLFAGSAVALAPASSQARTGGARSARRGGFFETRDGVRLFHRDWGDGAPIVFISAWTHPSDVWGYQIAALTQQAFRCIAYDRRGHGRSDDPGRGYDYDTLADDLADLMERLDLRSVTLVGHSMAAGEMVRLMSRRTSARVARLILVAPASTPCLAASVDPAVFEAARNTFMRDFPKWLRDNARPFVTPETSQATIDWMMGLTLQTALPTAIACHRMMTSADFRAELPRIRKPTLIIHGGRDVSAPIDITGRPTAALIPGAELRIYEDAPHGLLITHAERLIADIAAFARG